MSRKYQDVIGQVLAPPSGWGWPGYGQAVAAFGQNEGMAMAQQPFPPGCDAGPANVNTQIRPYGVALGGQCGPLFQRQYLPFEDVGCIEPGETVDICAFPQFWAKVTRIIICDHEASSLVITSITVGITPILAGKGVVPACALSPNAEGALLNSVTLYPNQPFCITVKNVTDAKAELHPTAIVEVITSGTPQIYGGLYNGNGC